MNRFIIMLQMFAVLIVSGCSQEMGDDAPDMLERYGIVEFYNPAAGRNVSQYGEIIGCTMKTLAPYLLEIVSDEQGWVVCEKGAAGPAGFNSIRLKFLPNEGGQHRSAEMYVSVEGYERTSVALFEQSRVMSEQECNETLNKYMHERLLAEYLWADAYSELEVDLTMDYRDFLSHHLLKLGDVNIEDGGLTGQHTADPGTRFIYSSIQAVTAGTKSVVSNVGLGFGPFFASALNNDGSIYCLAVSYVHPGSPADLAGVRRGDAIFMVNDEYVTSDNYEAVSDDLLRNPSGSYSLVFFRDGQVGDGKEMTASVSVGAYEYNPVIYTEVRESGDHVVGYMVLESFDYSCQQHLADAVNQMKAAGITDLVLDLRFNMGGSVAQSRWLTGCIAGASHLDDVFASLVYNDGSEEIWKFRGGPDELDGLGIAPDLGLDRLYVVGSYYTASASEMVINSLRGINGFEVYHIGGKTEGKNVGMTTTYTTVDGVRYMFSPITFRIRNAMGFGGYADGLEPDIVLSDQDMDFNDGDIDVIFPFSFSNWDVEGTNKALDLVMAMLNASKAAPHSCNDAKSGVQLTPVAPCAYPIPSHGRYGSVI